jgi:uncharacterized protein (DUF342 family)
VDVSKSRLEKLQKKLAEDRQSLRELVQRSKAQMTQRHQDLKDHLQGRLTRGRIIIEKLEKRLAAAQSKLTYNADSRIIVSELLTSSVQIIIGGQVVAVTNDVAGVGVLPKRRRGNFIVPIEEVEEEMKANGKLNKAS